MQLKFRAASSASALVLKRAGVPLFSDSVEQPISENDSPTTKAERMGLKLFKILLVLLEVAD